MPVNGGLSIAILGSDGAGKSTNLEALVGWLSSSFKVEKLHVGRPRASFQTRFYSRLARLTEQLSSGGCTILNPNSSGCALWPDLFAWIPAKLYLNLAKDRWKTVRLGRRLVDCGHIVLYDRYPMDGITMMDSPRVPTVANTQCDIYRKMAEKERDIYREIGNPDLIVLLLLDPELAARRQPGDGRDYVLKRAEEVVRFSRTLPKNVLVVDAGQPLEVVTRNIKNAIWARL